MIKVVAFDFGGVVGGDADEWDTTFKKVLDTAHVSNSQILEVWDKYWPTLKLGQGDIMDFWNELAKINNTNSNELRQIYNESIRIDNNVLEIAKKLKNKYKVIILSNDTKDWMEAKKRRFKLSETFETIYNSADLGMAKPDREIFDYVLKDLKIKPEEFVFIDNQDNNYQAAKQIGIKAILFTSIEKLISSISDL